MNLWHNLWVNEMMSPVSEFDHCRVVNSGRTGGTDTQLESQFGQSSARLSLKSGASDRRSQSVCLGSKSVKRILLWFPQRRLFDWHCGEWRHGCTKRFLFHWYPDSHLLPLTASEPSIHPVVSCLYRVTFLGLNEEVLSNLMPFDGIFDAFCSHFFCC